MSTAIRSGRQSNWEAFCSWVTDTNNRIYVGWFGVLMIPCLLAAPSASSLPSSPLLRSISMASVSLSLAHSSTATTSSPVLLFLPRTPSAFTSIPSGKLPLDEWLYNGGPYQLVVFHFLIGISAYMGRQWELSYRLGMRPWICVAYSAPLSAAFAVFLAPSVRLLL